MFKLRLIVSIAVAAAAFSSPALAKEAKTEAKKSAQAAGCVGNRGGKYKDYNDCFAQRKAARYCSTICK